MDESTAEKAKGNEAFKKGEFLQAAGFYTKAIKKNTSKDIDLEAICRSNRSASFLKEPASPKPDFHCHCVLFYLSLQLNKVTKALEDAEICVNIKPDWVKGHMRLANALLVLER